jgi:hypothetical protein
MLISAMRYTIHISTQKLLIYEQETSYTPREISKNGFEFGCEFFIYDHLYFGFFLNSLYTSLNRYQLLKENWEGLSLAQTEVMHIQA